MIAELIGALIKANIAVATAVLVVFLIRQPWRRVAGSGLAYGLWVIVPITAVASLAPLRTISAPLPDTPVWSVMPATAQLLAKAKAAQHPEPNLFLAGIWALGALLCFAICVVAHRRFLNRLGALEPIAGENQPLRAQARGFGPAVIGALAPRIIVPGDFDVRFTAEERRVILTHESVHLRRGDALVNGLVVVCQCLCWFNPFIHVAAHLMRQDQELSCDAEVIARHPGMRKTYAEAMLKTQLAGASLAFGCYWPARSEHPLKQRLAMLKATSTSRSRRRISVTVACMLAAGLSFGAWAVQPPVIQGPKLVAGDPRLANTGFVNYFDATSPVEIRGRITRVDLREPRAFVYLTDGTGRTWAAMGGSPKQLGEAQRARLAPGTLIQIRGYRAWDRKCEQGCVINARSLTWPNAPAASK